MTATLLDRARRATPLGWSARPRVPVLAAALLLVALVTALCAAVAFDRAYTGRILPGVSVAGIDLAGASPEEARQRLAAVRFEPAALTVVVGSRAETLTAEALGRGIAIDAAVDAAMAAGRRQGFLGDIGERLGLLRDGRALALDVTVDEPTLTAWLASAAGDVRRAPVESRVKTVEGGWEATPSAPGSALHEAEAAELIRAALLGGAAGTPRLVLPVVAVSPSIDHADASLAISRAIRMVATVKLALDDETWTIPSKSLRRAIDFTAANGQLFPVTSGPDLAPAIAALAKDVRVAPRETLFLAPKSGGTFGFVPGRAGRSLDAAVTGQRVRELLAARRDGRVDAGVPVAVATVQVQPKIGAEQAAAIAPRMTRISSWTTRFVVGEKNGFGNNITIPARLINGTVVMPGQVFDFWRAVGPVTTARGFRMGGIIQDGRTIPTGAIGGGICSASTTLFNAAARAGLQILERDNHSYYITRYPLGLDATVSKAGGVSVQNLRFRNDTHVPIFIRGVAGGGWVRFEIYSQPIGRTVTFSRPSVTNVRRAVDRVIRTSDLRAGTSRRDETPANGMDVVVFRTVRDANGRVIHSDRFVSHYIRVDGILLVGTG